MKKKTISWQAVFFLVCIALCLIVAICFALKPQV